MWGVDGHINNVARLHALSGSRRLFQDAIRGECLLVTSIDNLNFKPQVAENMLGIGKLRVFQVGNGNGFTVMRINIKSELRAKAKQNHDDGHGYEVLP